MKTAFASGFVASRARCIAPIRIAAVPLTQSGWVQFPAAPATTLQAESIRLLVQVPTDGRASRDRTTSWNSARSHSRRVPAENGGIHGHVVYASTRPFDDPTLLLQLSWEPLVPHVKINLYQEGFAPDGVTKTLTLVDTTETTSLDDWVQGFRSDGSRT